LILKQTVWKSIHNTTVTLCYKSRALKQETHSINKQLAGILSAQLS